MSGKWFLIKIIESVLLFLSMWSRPGRNIYIITLNSIKLKSTYCRTNERNN